MHVTWALFWSILFWVVFLGVVVLDLYARVTGHLMLTRFFRGLDARYPITGVLYGGFVVFWTMHFFGKGLCG